MSRGQIREVKAARYRHRCDWCGEMIAVGETYKRQPIFGESTVWTDAFNPECYEAEREALAASGAFPLFWMPGDYRRGTTEKIHVEEDIPW